MWNRTDIIGSVLLILVGTGVIVESIRLHIGTPLRPQPGFFPFLGGFLLIGLSVVLLVQGWLGRGKSSLQDREAYGELLRPLILIVSLGAYTVVLESVGYVLPTIIIAGIILRVLGVKSWKMISLASVGLSVGTYVLFGRVLGIDLPAGCLAFLG
jgi:putative tricarboxylic transport membrane protein